MQNCKSSARTAAQQSSKCSLLFRQAPLLAILMLAVVLFSQDAKCQTFDFGFNNDCGTWVANPDYYTDWSGVDTLIKKPIKDTIRNWGYDNERMQVSNSMTLEYSPCGNGRPTTWEQYRVCQITGIRQIRYRIRSYNYLPKPKNIRQPPQK